MNFVGPVVELHVWEPCAKCCSVRGGYADFKRRRRKVTLPEACTATAECQAVIVAALGADQPPDLASIAETLGPA